MDATEKGIEYTKLKRKNIPSFFPFFVVYYLILELPHHRPLTINPIICILSYISFYLNQIIHNYIFLCCQWLSWMSFTRRKLSSTKRREEEGRGERGESINFRSLVVLDYTQHARKYLLLSDS